MTDSVKDCADTIQRVLSDRLLHGSVDLVDIVQIPKHGDRMVRLQTIQEALEDFESADLSEGTIGYLIQVRPARSTSLPENEPPGPEFVFGTPNPAVDGTYLPSGKLNTQFLLKNAELLFTAGEYNLARNIYNAILASGENTAIALFGLARCFETEGKFKEAQTHYEESIAYHGTLTSYHALASLHASQKQYSQVIEVLSRALHLKDLTNPQRYILNKESGNACLQSNQFAKACHHFQKAIELDPTANEVRTDLGTAYLRDGKIELALRAFQEAISANPKSDQALAGLGHCALAKDDKRAAHDYFAKSLRLNLNNPTAVFHLVKCAYELKSYSIAAEILEQYIENAPINTNLLYSLAGLHFHLSRFSDARATLNTLFQMAPNHAGAKELSLLIDRYVEVPTQ